MQRLSPILDGKNVPGIPTDFNESDETKA